MRKKHVHKMGEKEKRMSWVSGPESHAVVTQISMLLINQTSFSMQSRLDSRSLWWHREQGPSTARKFQAPLFVVITDCLPALVLTVPGPLLGLLPSSCSWWPFWLGSLSEENHRGTLYSTVGRLPQRGRVCIHSVAGSRALGLDSF